jgi:hypothetical protein
VKKSPAQLDREIASVLAARAAERRSTTTASGVVKKLLGKARRLLSRQRADLDLRDPARTIDQLSAIAREAIGAAELELAGARLPAGYEGVWAQRFEDHLTNARGRLAELRQLRTDPRGYAQVAPQRFGPDVSADLATALYYVSALDGLQAALRRIEAMIAR